MLPGHMTSAATGVSGDGAVVVGGDGIIGGGSVRAFRWTAATGIVDLVALPGMDNAFATGVSSDGSVVVGYCYGYSTVRSDHGHSAGPSTTGMVDLGVTARSD